MSELSNILWGKDKVDQELYNMAEEDYSSILKVIIIFSSRVTK
jgi:hypothetical protein